MGRRKINLTPEQKACSMSAVQDAINFIAKKNGRIIGAQKELADLLNVKRQTIGKFLHGILYVPVDRAIQIERITNGEVKSSQLRPDIF